MQLDGGALHLDEMILFEQVGEKFCKRLNILAEAVDWQGRRKGICVELQGFLLKGRRA